MRRLIPVATAAAAALLGTTLFPASAWAATYSLRTSAVGTDGYATGSGRVMFSDSNSLKVASTVADRCGTGDGDGEGAYLWIAIEYMNGSMDKKLSLNWDNNGCDNGSRGTRTATFNPGVNVRRVRIRLDEADGPSDPSETVYSAWKDNPYT